MTWDFAEGSPFSVGTAGWDDALEAPVRVLESTASWLKVPGRSCQGSATAHALADDTVDLLVTDPPYYNAVPYADLSDFFVVWLLRTIGDHHPSLFVQALSPKEEEICEMAGWDSVRYPHKDKLFFEVQMRAALMDARRVVSPAGVSVIVFAHKSTSGWEAMLQSIIDAGWIIVASWPIDTEMGNRLRALNSAALASSVHLVCRPRENPDGSIRTDSIGDWRDVLDELPGRIRAWMKRLKEEGVVGADAIFACLGPALEIFSRYSRVEKGSGDTVPLQEYLQHVWATVSHEAVKMIFEGAEADSLEPDARLTTMWLWTIGGGKRDEPASEEAEEEPDDAEEKTVPKASAGFVLESDAARMIAQGLGIYLAKSEDIVEAKGQTARLLSVSERASYLFGKGADMKGAAPAPSRKKKEQLTLGLGSDDSAPASTTRSDRFGTLQISRPGATVLDRLHQAMILFGAGRSEALRAFLVDDGHGRDERLWRLADSLSALYPPGSEERRWVEGVSGRKKAFGF